MFFGSSRHDEWVRFERAQATAEAFAKAGAKVTFETYEDREHHINDDAVAGVRRLLADARTGA
jgi:predicted esterase